MDFSNKSERIAEGLRRSFENPDCKMANRTCYGYDTLSNGALVINKSDAQTVRWIFDCYLAGTSLGKIAAGLEKLCSLSRLQSKVESGNHFSNCFRMKNTPIAFCCKNTEYLRCSI